MEASENDIKSPNINETVVTMGKKGTPNLKNNSSKLIIKAIESLNNPDDQVYEISSDGLKNGLRKSKDGCVYAGYLEKQGNLVVNDIVLNPKEKGVGKRHFMIKYQKGNGKTENSKYYIKDMGEGLGTFIRIDNPLKLKNDYIICFGDTHMIVRIDSSILALRFIEGPKIDQKT